MKVRILALLHESQYSERTSSKVILPSDVKYRPDEEAWSVKEFENHIVDDVRYSFRLMNYDTLTVQAGT